MYSIPFNFQGSLNEVQSNSGTRQKVNTGQHSSYNDFQKVLLNDINSVKQRCLKTNSLDLFTGSIKGR